MHFRRYISTFIIILTVLGVVNQQQTTAPNQEIVLQFVDNDSKSSYAQETIATLTKQLEKLGVENIKIHELGNSLKITYYSSTDASSIKNVLSNEQSLDVDFSSKESSFPSENSAITYNLDVYELQEINSNDWSFDGHVLEVKTESDRFSNPNAFTFLSINEADDKCEYYEVALKINNTIALAIDTISYKIPEVRAGPSC